MLRPLIRTKKFHQRMTEEGGGEWGSDGETTTAACSVKSTVNYFLQTTHHVFFGERTKNSYVCVSLLNQVWHVLSAWDEKQHRHLCSHACSRCKNILFTHIEKLLKDLRRTISLSYQLQRVCTCEMWKNTNSTLQCYHGDFTPRAGSKPTSS